MRIKPTNYILSIIFFSLIFGCANDHTFKLIDTNFDEEIKSDQNLSFIFSKPLVGDSVLNRWDSTEYIRFEPKIPGSFRWSSESVLVFSPQSPFPPATNYKATFTEKLSKKVNYDFEGDQTISFRTQLLELVNVTGFWSDTKDGQTMIHVDANFNFDVDKNEVLKKVKVNIEGKLQKIELMENSDQNVVRFFLPDIAIADEAFMLEVEVEAGLLPKRGNIKTIEKSIRSLALKSPYNVSIEDVTAEHNGVEGVLNVDVSQETTDGAKEFISISPRLDYQVELTEKGLKVSSEDFDLRKKYSITIKNGLKGKFGGTLKSDFNKEISFGKLRPEITITDKRSTYLSANGAKNIQVKIINVEELEVKLTKLYENNILNFTRNKYYDYENDSYSYNYHSVEEQGDVIWNKKIVSKDLPKKGGLNILNLNVEDKIKGYNGIYVLQISSDENYWLRDSKLISISDIGLVAKEGKNDITVFSNSIKTASPKSGVEVSFYGRNNQLVGTSVTDNSGVAIFHKPTDVPDGFQVAMITAKNQDDYNYMTFSSTGVNTSKFDIGGKYVNLSGFDVFIYGDRDIYRPGETVNLSGIIRDEEWQTPAPIPLKVSITTPDGKTLQTFKKILNEFGSFETSLELSTAAATGSYGVQVYTTNDIYLGAKNFKVEEFMPDRIKVEVQIDKVDLDLAEIADIKLKATNFFGPPAANRNYELNISARRKYFYSKDYRSYNFNIETPNNIYFEQTFLEGKTDSNGEAQNSYQLGQQYQDMGLVQADVFTTVFDETGRPVNRKNTLTISTQEVYYGIASDRYYAATNSEIQFPMVALDKNGEVLSGVKTHFQLIKHEYKTVLSRSGGYFRYRSEKVEKVLEDKEILISGKDEYYSFIPELSGRYELRLSTPGTRNYVSKDFYAYGWGGTSNSSFQVNSEGQIDIELDKESYKVGETANVILKSPFSGKILVTLETDKILKYFYVDTDKRSTSFPIEIQEGFVPNIYITATLFKPHEESDLPLTIAHGVAPMMVENPSNKLPLAIESAESSRSMTKQKIRIKSTPYTAISVAVVDEGILQLTQYASPDPYEHFYRKRALGVQSYDVYPYLFPEINLTSGRVGGDDSRASQLAKRVNPLTNKRVKLVSFWSGILQTDGSGNVSYEIDIPQFSGDLRIMATAYKDHTFASSQSNIKVADPIVISTALPRFLSPGDTVLVPVILSNTTEKATQCETTLNVSGQLTLLGNKSMKTEVAANAEGQVIYKLVAKQALGQSKVAVDVNALGESFKNSTDITVRPASPLQKVSGSGSVKAGESLKLSLENNKFIPQSVQRNLVISNSPMVEFTKNLDYLLRYPYGCVEQTISSVFPQLYFQELSEQIFESADDAKNTNSHYHITEAIKKLQLMQLYHGGLAYWPGQGYESWWGSVYAAHFLFEAQKVGFEVDQNMYKKLLDYLITKLKTKETIFYFYNDTKRKIAHKEIPYSLYVLALAGKAQRSTMNYYKSNINDLSLDGKYLLAAAYALIGDDKKYHEVLPPAFSGEKSKRVFGGSFHSYIRDEALALNVLLEVEKDDPQVGVMARHLSQALKDENYLNTQELAFSFLALGKIAKQNAGSNIKASIKSNGKTLADYNNKTLSLNSNQLDSKELSIETSGNGSLYYFWETEGISDDGSYREEDSFLKVRKKFYDRKGKLITGNTFNQNDLIVVNLSIQAVNNKRVENVAMTDILPAGFEIENPRITEVPGTDWIKNAATSEYTDIRDDRISYFMTVEGGVQNYYYVVRAISKGTFQMGPVGADAMYNGEYHSYSGGGIIVVK